jgi:hypothetical protein
MNWFEARRMEWIDESVRIFGYINRAHLMSKFGISMPQASKDLRTFMEKFPNKIEYNLKMKYYQIKGR